MSDGTTHAAEKAANTRPWIAGGYTRATTTYSATVCPPTPRPWMSRPDDEDLHRRREPRHDRDPTTNSATDGGQRREHAAAIAPRADGHHADDARGERAGERDRVERRAVEVGAHDRHHGRHRERLHRREEDERDGADGDPDVLRAPDATGTPDGSGREGRMVDRSGHGPTSAPTALDGLAQHLGRAAEVDADVPLALFAEERTEVEGHLRVAQDLHGGIVAPAEVGEVDPREEAGIRDPIARTGHVLGEQLGEQAAIAVEGRRVQPVEPLVALRRERRDAGEGAEQSGAPLHLGRAGRGRRERSRRPR